MTVYDNALRFWEYFEYNEKDLLQALEAHDYPVLREVLGKVDERLYKYTGAHFFVEDVADQPEMTFDTGPNKTIQYLAQYFAGLAPESVRKTWIINPLLPPLSQKAIEAAVKIKDEEYALTDFTVFYTVDEKAQMFSLEVYCPGFGLIGNPEYKREMALYLVETAIGETAYEAYIAHIEAIDKPGTAENFCNLVDLYEVVEQTVEKLGWKHYTSALDIYSVYQPFQDIAHDALRKDMKIIFTTHPLLAEESLGEGQDVLLDLEAKGGEYGYVYYINPLEGKDNALFRQQLARQLGTEMEKIHAAQVIGGAMGKSYSYIDLIVYDIPRFEQAFEQLQKQLHDKVEMYFKPFREGNGV